MTGVFSLSTVCPQEGNPNIRALPARGITGARQPPESAPHFPDLREGDRSEHGR